jgi:hypothetical protein
MGKTLVGGMFNPLPQADARESRIFRSRTAKRTPFGHPVQLSHAQLRRRTRGQTGKVMHFPLQMRRPTVGPGYPSVTPNTELHTLYDIPTNFFVTHARQPAATLGMKDMMRPASTADYMNVTQPTDTTLLKNIFDRLQQNPMAGPMQMQAFGSPGAGGSGIAPSTSDTDTYLNAMRQLPSGKKPDAPWWRQLLGGLTGAAGGVIFPLGIANDVTGLPQKIAGKEEF